MSKVRAKTIVNDGWKQPKKRKPMTEEQKKAACERLAKAKLADCEGYIRHLQYYLRHGDYCDDRYGAFQEKRIKWKTIVPKG